MNPEDLEEAKKIIYSEMGKKGAEAMRKKYTPKQLSNLKRKAQEASIAAKLKKRSEAKELEETELNRRRRESN